MEHGITWLSFLPGYDAFQAYLRSQFGRGVMGSETVPQHVYAAILVAIIVLAVAIKARLELRRAGSNALVPDEGITTRNVLELVLERVHRQMKQIIGEDCNRYLPVIGTLALFIFVSNVLGLVPGFTPPTDNWNTTFACSIFVCVYYHIHGIRAHGLGHIAHMANPTGLWWGWFLAPLMFPIELITHIARPFSLGIRLAANMVGDHAVLVAFLGLVPILVPIPFMILGLVVSIVQTLVFVLLSMIYIGLAVAGEHGHDEEHDKHKHASEHSPAVASSAAV